MDLGKYPILIFDLDGTLAPSKSVLQPEVSKKVCSLLEEDKIIVVISGGAFHQFEKQFLGSFNCDKNLLKNLYLLPTSGSSLYAWSSETDRWQLQYEHPLTQDEKDQIYKAFDWALAKVSFLKPEKLWGEQIEDRGTQITYSALGQKAPVDEKLNWDPGGKNRHELADLLNQRLNGLVALAGGSTSVDILKKGIDKGFGVEEFLKYGNFQKKDAIFFGDALEKGENDFPVVKTGVKTVAVTGPEELLSKLA